MDGKLTGKKVLLRVDYNVPMKNGRVKDDYKIKRELETLDFLVENKAKIIVITHLGKPGGKMDRKYSVRPIADLLGRLTHKDVRFVEDCAGADARVAVEKIGAGDILMLENARFFPGEEKNDPVFARDLAKLADIYVNDAFAVSHRAHASVAAIKEYLPAYAGLLLAQEAENMQKALKPSEPQVAIIGGAKLSTKIPLIKNLAAKSKYVLLGGALANNFFAARGFEVGKSLVEPDSIKLAASLLKDYNNIELPVDCVVSADEAGEKGEMRAIGEVGRDEYIFDIGPQTVKAFAKFIKEAATIVWNGPVGLFEKEHFKHGTLAIARLVAAQSTGRAFGIVGGGETVEALRLTKMTEYVDWISTGGGAMLSYLGGESMPGLDGIIE